MVHFIFIAPMHSCVTDVLVYNLHMTRFSRVYSYVTRVYSYVTRMYSCVIRMLLVCTRMLLVCTRVYSYVTRMYSYVARMLLVCSFSHNPLVISFHGADYCNHDFFRQCCICNREVLPYRKCEPGFYCCTICY